MKTVLRIMLFIIALALGSLLGYYLLLELELLKMILFGVACILLGKILYEVDKKIMDMKL